MDLVVKSAGDYRAFRISPGDTNYMACVFDRIGEDAPFTCVVEIYALGGKTPPTSVHVIEHTGPSKLYALCTMVPNEEFAEMIHSGTPVPLDAEDIAVLTGQRVPA